MTKTTRGADLFMGDPPAVISVGKESPRFNRDWLRCGYGGEEDTGLIRISEIVSVERRVVTDDSRRIAKEYLAARGVIVTMKSGQVLELTDAIYSEVALIPRAWVCSQPLVLYCKPMTSKRYLLMRMGMAGTPIPLAPYSSFIEARSDLRRRLSAGKAQSWVKDTATGLMHTIEPMRPHGV